MKRVQMAHGGGGRLMQQLLREHVAAAFGEPVLRHDGAVLAGAMADGELVMTTDASVVTPLFFPGGDLGKLAVYGAVNDLAVTGARPVALSLALVLEEGLPLETLDRLLSSVKAAADEVGVSVVTGDTKVVERGRCDGVYAATTGIGRRLPGVNIDARRVREGDRILLSGDIGRHGIAVLSVREGLSFGGAVESDCAPLSGPALDLLRAVPSAPFLRDCTRGGVAAVLHELARAAGVSVSVEEASIPVSEPVRGACAILGLDPMSLACEGRFLAVVPPADVDSALSVLSAYSQCPGAAVVGTIGGSDPGGAVWLSTAFGQERPLDYPSGEHLPRIC